MDISQTNASSLPPTAKKRDPAMDMLRIFAFAAVISIHFYMNSGFYSENVAGPCMFLMVAHRTAMMVCVPLFIVLSGYLPITKPLSSKHYAGLGKNLLLYLLASLACLLCRSATPAKLPLSRAVYGVINFTAAPYAWYVEMYIGLALLSPFLNILYHGLDTKKKKQWLLITMLLLTAVPSIFNIYNFTTPDWWRSPALAHTYQTLMPDWWVGIYPITYYFIGCYLREYPPKIKKSALFLAYCAAALLFGAYAYFRSYGVPYYDGAVYLEWYSLPTVFLTVAAFVFFLNVPTGNLPAWLAKLLAKLSDLCFGAYLLSWISDSLLYPPLNAAIPQMQLRFPWIFLMVPAGVLFSFALSYVVNLLQQLLLRGIHALWKCRKIS